jgi:perosamine synthetase
VLIRAMAERGIDTRPLFYPLSSLPAYASLAGRRGAAENPVAYGLSPRGLNLPSALNLTRAQVKHVCDTLKELLATAS